MWLRSRSTISHFTAIIYFSRPQCLVLSSLYSGACEKKKKIAPLQERRMVDQCRLWAKGGNGGNGCSSIRRSRHDLRGKPDGGNGGRGGDVILECSTSVWDFSNLQHHVKAKRGGNGAPKNMVGTRGADKVVLVPVGTVLHLIKGEIPSSVEKKAFGPLDPWDIPGSLGSPESSIDEGNKSENRGIAGDGSTLTTKEIPNKPAYGSALKASPLLTRSRDIINTETRAQCADYCEGEMSMSEPDEDVEETKEIQYDVAELMEPGHQLVVAVGGDGGIGNIHSGRRSKKYRDAEEVEISEDEEEEEENPERNIGTPGSETVLMLELKSIADVGLVGLPNAGKSTLLGAISRAKPVIGHYAFTTMRPNLGNLSYDDLKITVADIPGLIRGAHQNRGLGHAFLRHIERTKVLAYVLDLASGLDGRKGIPPWEQLRDLMLELECYREGLSERPSLLVANKIDEAGTEEVLEELKERVSGVPIYPVCAVLEEGIDELKAGLKMLVNGQESSSLKLDSVVLD